MFSSDCPTNLLRISGPLTTLGSRALSILPICRAINVLPVPGGPYRRIPVGETILRTPQNNGRGEKTDGRTLDMLDAELLDESGWEDSRRESASEDGGELGVESTDTHVFELEIRRQDRVGRRPSKRNKSDARHRRRRMRSLTHFFALDLILMALAGSLIKLISVWLVKMPDRAWLEDTAPLPSKARLCRPLTVALRFWPWKSNTSGCPTVTMRPSYARRNTSCSSSAE